MTEITFGGNFFIGGKSAELHPFSTVSQVTRYEVYQPSAFPASACTCPADSRAASEVRLRRNTLTKRSR